MTVPVLTPAEMTFLIGSRYLPLATITDPRILAVVGAVDGPRPAGCGVGGGDRSDATATPPPW